MALFGANLQRYGKEYHKKVNQFCFWMERLNTPMFSLALFSEIKPVKISKAFLFTNGKDLYAIVSQSGPLYTDWGWFLSEKESANITKFLKYKTNCTSKNSVYDCLRDKSLDEIEGYRTEYATGSYPFFNPWHPTPDNFFFNENITKEDYNFVNK